MVSRSSRVVIIGAGIVGTNVADELASRGWTNITVIEQGPLSMPGGSTSHAPGLVFQTNSSRTMTRLASYTVEKLSSLTKDGQSCFNQVGGLEIATTPARLQELKRRHGWAASAGVTSHLVDADTCMSLYPLLNRGRVLGGLHIPSDGLALAARAVQLLIDRTRQAGVRYLEHTVVEGINQQDGRVTGVITSRGEIRADIVISCAGFWGVEVGKMVDLAVPLLPMAHQYAKTTAVRPLAAKRPAEGAAHLPILRHQDKDLYFREHGDHIGIGYYGHQPMPVDAATLGATSKQVTAQEMPSRLPFSSEDFAPAWEESRDLLPALQHSELGDAFNGIFSFTPDGGPLVGEHPSLEGFHVAEAVWVTHSAGVARALAEVLTDGRSMIDLGECDLNRFDEVQLTKSYVEETSKQNFVEVYDIIHPLEQRQSPRNLRISPFHVRQCQLKAAFVEAHGWERPHHYAVNGVGVEDLPGRWQPLDRDEWSARHYSPAVAVEAHALQNAAAMYDLTSLRRLSVIGPGASHLLQHLCTIDVTGPSNLARYALLLDPFGGIKSEVTIHKYSVDKFMLECNGNQDLVYLSRHAQCQSKSSPNLWVQVQDVTTGTCCIGFWGPATLEIMQTISSHIDPGRHGAIDRVVIGGIPTTVARLSMVGDYGWQIYVSADSGLRVWDALQQAGHSFGLVAAGRAAVDSLRIQRGFKFWGTDMTTEHTPNEAGLEWAVDKRKTGYVGWSDLHGQSSSRKRLVKITIDDGRSMIMGKEPVYHGEQVVGYVTSAAFGYGLGKPVAFVWLDRPDVSRVEVEYFGRRIPATVVSDGLKKSRVPGTIEAML